MFAVEFKMSEIALTVRHL